MGTRDERCTDLSKAMRAGLLLAARTHLQSLGLPCPSSKAILHAAGASHSRAYVCRDAILGNVHKLSGQTGRPTNHSTELDVSLMQELVEFLLAHPGAAHVRGQRRHYSPAFRRFVIELRARHPSLSAAALARCLHVPVATLSKWLDATTPARAASRPPPEPHPAHVAIPPQRLTSLLDEWQRWRGSLSGFCRHAQENLGITMKRSALTRLLHRLGMRMPRRRDRARQAGAPRQSFTTFFPGAQWIGDGALIPVTINGERFLLNLELMVDSASGAIVGTAIRSNEDSTAVVQAFDQAVATTGAPPLALLLDNRPCNRSARLASACRPTLVLHAARGRPQTKGHVEGAFGLFAQQASPLTIQATTSAELARQVLGLVALSWARALNHKPRRDRGGRSRVELYHAAAPTAQDRAHAATALHHRRTSERRHASASDRQGHAAARALIADAAGELMIGELDDRLIAVMAAHPIAAIAAAIALYQGKRSAGTLPEMASAEHRGRYLLALIRAAAQEHEEQAMARSLLVWRDRALDHLQAAWRHEHATLIARQEALPPHEARSALIDGLVDRAIAAKIRIEQCFWLDAVARLVREPTQDPCAAIYGQACSRILRDRTLPYAHRRALMSMLAAAMVPLD